jgi:putative ABC transport system permease protein
VRDLTGGVGTVPLSTVDTIKADARVEWAVPVRTAYFVLELHNRKVPVYVVGTRPGDRGAAWSITQGRAPANDREIVVDSILARRHHVKVGDTLDAMGHPLRVVGRTTATGYMFAYVFVTHSAVDRLTGSSGVTNFVMIRTQAPSAVAGRLRAAGLNVLTKEQVTANNLKFATGIFGSPIRVMVAIGFAAGTLIMALTAYTTVVERRREYGIVKAMGATGMRLTRLAVAQTITLAAMGVVAGAGLFAVGRYLITESRPQFTVVFTTGAFGRAVLASILMALLAAIVPARRLARLEPATAYRSAA